MAPARPDPQPANPGIHAAEQRELYFFTLYRCFEAALLAFVVFSPFARELIMVLEPVVARVASAAYLALAVTLLLLARKPHIPLTQQVAAGLLVDIAIALIAKQALVGAGSGISLLLIVNIGAGALLLPMHWAMGVGMLAGAATFLDYLLAAISPGRDARNLAEVSMFSVTYLATALLTHMLGRQMRESVALADRRGVEVANLAQLNELIIRRMRSGVVVVDAEQHVRLINEAAWGLLGEPSPTERSLPALAPELAQRLHRWRQDRTLDSSPVALAPDRPSIIPRFAKLTAIDDLFLIFLDDSAMVARRAEELTLSTLGRLSASIAHEIRNPLAAIRHSAQLLDESPDLPDTDRRLVEIILNHCMRMNGIVENVLGLSRRERSRPEQVDLAAWVHQFAEEYKAGHFLDRDELRAVSQHRRLFAVIDPQQLHQVVSALVHNALTYGRLPGEPARVAITARQPSESASPLVEVIDRGPGIPPAVVQHVFDAFYTTSEYGSGLGLYIARQLCEVNQAVLEYVEVPGGGSCFRISMQRPRGFEFVETRNAPAAN